MWFNEKRNPGARRWITAAIGLSIVALVAVGTSCQSGPQPPQPGTPAFFWAAAGETYRAGDEVILVINGYGATTRMEMFIVNRKIRAMLAELKIQVYATEIGEFCTSQEMKGLSITLVKLDEELKTHFDSPCKCPSYVRF